VCRAALWAPASPPLGQRRCPRCGAELWVLVLSEGPTFFPRRPGESLSDLLTALAGPQLGLAAGEMEMPLKDADSLDVVEMLMEVEEAMRSGGPGESASGGTVRERQ
jgi:hypothetical protein